MDIGTQLGYSLPSLAAATLAPSNSAGSAPTLPTASFIIVEDQGPLLYGCEGAIRRDLIDSCGILDSNIGNFDGKCKALGRIWKCGEKSNDCDGEL
jgi:hypothetical protein